MKAIMKGEGVIVKEHLPFHGIVAKSVGKFSYGDWMKYASKFLGAFNLTYGGEYSMQAYTRGNSSNPDYLIFKEQEVDGEFLAETLKKKIDENKFDFHPSFDESYPFIHVRIRLISEEPHPPKGSFTLIRDRRPWIERPRRPSEIMLFTANDRENELVDPLRQEFKPESIEERILFDIQNNALEYKLRHRFTLI